MSRPERRGGPAPAVTWPPVGARAALAVPGEEPRPTRVEDATADAVAVAPPRSGKGELEPPEPGDRFELSWPGERGLVVVPVALRERVPGRVALWWLEPVAAVAVQQRRSYVRAAVAAPLPVRVALEWERPERGSAAGELLDLSEGGLRAHLGGEGADGCREGAGVSVRMTLVDAAGTGGGSTGTGTGSGGVDVVEHELFGTVLRAGRLPQAPETTEVVVQLHDDAAQGDALRRLVFAWQRRARQR